MSPRSKIDNELIKAERKAHILEVSLALFAGYGYESTSISKIAQKAGISKGLLYNYFSSKEDLLKELVLDLGKMDGEFMGSVLVEDPLKTLENIINAFFTILVEQRDQLKLITALAYQVDKFAFIQAIAQEKAFAYHQLFEQLFTQIGIENPKNEARMLGVAFDGIAAQFLIIEKDYPLDDFKKYLLKKYCKK